MRQKTSQTEDHEQSGHIHPLELERLRIAWSHCRASWCATIVMAVMALISFLTFIN